MPDIWHKRQLLRGDMILRETNIKHQDTLEIGVVKQVETEQ